MQQRELTFAFWSAWILLIVGYFVEVHALGTLMEHPDNNSTLSMLVLVLLPLIIVCSFICINTIVSVISRAWHKDINRRLCCKHMAVELCTRPLLSCLELLHLGSCIGFWF